MLLRLLTIVSFACVAHAYFRVYEPSDHCHNAPPTTDASVTSLTVTDLPSTDSSSTSRPLTTAPTTSALRTTVPITVVPNSIVPTTSVPVTSTSTTTTPPTNPPTPCTSCDITSISPNNLIAGTDFQIQDITPAGRCVQTLVTCKRIDDQYCEGVSITATTPTGDSAISFSTGTSIIEASAFLACQIGGTYAAGIYTQISQLSCVFTGCYPPSCSSCDVNRIRPLTTPSGTEFTFTDEISDGCKYSEVTCARTDGLICQSITLQATYASVSGGPHLVDFKLRVGSASFKLSCAPDGNYASLDTIKQLSCEFDSCA